MIFLIYVVFVLFEGWRS